MSLEYSGHIVSLLATNFDVDDWTTLSQKSLSAFKYQGLSTLNIDLDEVRRLEIVEKSVECCRRHVLNIPTGPFCIASPGSNNIHERILRTPAA